MWRILASIGAALGVLAAAPAARSEPLGQIVTAGQGPWVAFILLVGGLAVAILLIAALGGGVGPRPTTGDAEADPENGDEPTDESADEG